MPPCDWSDPSARWSSGTGWTPTSPAPSRRNTPSLLVFTGVSTAADLLAAVPEQRPTYLSFDLRGLVEEDRSVRIPTTSSAGSGLEWSVTSDTDALLLSGNQAADGGISDASALRALAMLTARAWATGITRARSNGPAAQAALERCGLASGSAELSSSPTNPPAERRHQPGGSSPRRRARRRRSNQNCTATQRRIR